MTLRLPLPLVALLVALCATPLAADQPIEGRYIVTLTPASTTGSGASSAARGASLLGQTGGTLLDAWDRIGSVVLAELEPAELERLLERPEVVAVEPDTRFDDPFGLVVPRVGPAAGPSTGAATEPATEGLDCFATSPPPSLTGTPPWTQTISCATPSGACVDAWGLDRSDQRSLPRDAAYSFGFGTAADPAGTGRGVHVYLLDSGLFSSHQDFDDRVGTGFNATGDGQGTGDCVSNGHGTMVAGLVGGSTYGVAKEVTLHPVRISDCAGLTTTSWLLAGLDWIATHRQDPAVVNISLNLRRGQRGADGQTYDLQAVSDAVEALTAQGITVVNSAGNWNDRADRYAPTDVEAVIVAGGTEELSATAEGRWVRFPHLPWNVGNGYGSSYGAAVDIWAPARDLVSASNTDAGLGCRNTGTSFAAPLVTGVAALILEQEPSFGPSEVDLYLRALASCDQLPTSGPHAVGPGSPNRLLHALRVPLSTVRLAGLCV